MTSLGSGVGVFDEQTGGLLWNVAPLHDVTTATVFVHPIALVADPDTPGRVLLIVGELDGNLPLHPQSASGSVTAYDLATGATVWTNANGRLYLSNGGDGLAVFDAAGCGSATCTPLWTAPGGYGALAVTKIRVFAAGDIADVGSPAPLSVFDAAGCGSSVCAALWTSHESRTYSAPVVANGLVYATAQAGPTDVWPADGCSAATCDAVASLATNLNAPLTTLVADGRLFVAGESLLTYMPS